MRQDRCCGQVEGLAGLNWSLELAFHEREQLERVAAKGHCALGLPALNSCSAQFAKLGKLGLAGVQ